MHTACIPTLISVTSVTVTLKCVVYFALSQTVQWTSSCWHVRHCEKCINVLITTWEVLLLFMETVTTMCHVLLWLSWWKNVFHTQEVLWHLLYISHSFLYNHTHTTCTLTVMLQWHTWSSAADKIISPSYTVNRLAYSNCCTEKK
jgi:hypothetical protein